MMATSVLDGAVDSSMVSADMRQRCEQLGIAASALSDDFLRQCLCVMRVGRLDKHCTEMMDRTRRLTADDQVLKSNDELSSALARNGTEPEPDEHPEESEQDNLINSDVFIYVIVFIVIVYFLTFLYLCMKKRQREAEDAEAGTAGGAARRNNRNLAEDQPPSYDEVMGSGAVGGKNSEPPTYAEVLARSQQLDKVQEGAGS